MLAGTTTSLSVDFAFRAISEAKGDVLLNIQDEYTFFAEGKPGLAGARAILTDPFTNLVVATAISDAEGKVRFTGITEGQYQLTVNAEKHDGLTGAFQVNAGVTNEQDVFLHRQVVSYKWSVVPIETTDKYKLVLETVFETEVPMPVVTVDEPRLMPIVLPGQTTQMQITLRNHGLIQAEKVQIKVPEDPDYIFTPLIDYIDVLPAQSAVTIPITVRMREGNTLAARAASEGGLLRASELSALSSDVPISPEGWGSTIAKCLGIETVYAYVCDGEKWQKVGVKVDVVGCGEDIKDAGKSLLEHIADPTKANAASLTCDILGAILQCANAAGAEISDCTQAIISTVCGVGLGALTGGVGGAALGLGGALDDILGCLCSLDGGGTSPSTDGYGGDLGGGFGGGAGGTPGTAYARLSPSTAARSIAARRRPRRTSRTAPRSRWPRTASAPRCACGWSRKPRSPARRSSGRSNSTTAPRARSTTSGSSSTSATTRATTPTTSSRS